MKLSDNEKRNLIAACCYAIAANGANPQAAYPYQNLRKKLETALKNSAPSPSTEVRDG